MAHILHLECAAFGNNKLLLEKYTAPRFSSCHVIQIGSNAQFMPSISVPQYPKNQHHLGFWRQHSLLTHPPPALKFVDKKGNNKVWIFQVAASLTDTRMDESENHEDIIRVFPSGAVLGIDFGGTGIKGAPVDLVTGQLLTERIRIPTPEPATPTAVAEVIKKITAEFKWTGPIGVGMPSVVKKGIVRSAANIDKTWINIDANSLFTKATGCKVAVLNDADAAGYAELAFGAGKELAVSGVVLVCTVGTGLGTALFVDGKLVPNLEMGHIEVDGEEAEKVASDRVREREALSWKKFASRLSAFLARMELYLQPDIIILGGGVSKKDDKFLYLLSVPNNTPIVAAAMRNDAGIVGAALGGADLLRLQALHHQSKEEPEQALASGAGVKSVLLAGDAKTAEGRSVDANSPIFSDGEDEEEEEEEVESTTETRNGRSAVERVWVAMEEGSAQNGAVSVRSKFGTTEKHPWAL